MNAKVSKRKIKKHTAPKAQRNLPTLVFESQTDRLFNSVNAFFSDLKNFDQMYNYLKNHKIYVFEWGVTNFAKKKGTKYTVTNSIGSYEFIVYDRYKDKLKPYTKELFDFYARGNKFEAGAGEAEKLDTTLGQLHMFMWAIKNRVLDFVIACYDEIKCDYDQNAKHRKKRTPGRKRELSSSLSRSACIISDESDITDLL